MNDTELRQRQLARLRGELTEPPIDDSALEFVPDPDLDAAYARDCASARNWDREPEPRGEWEAKHKELMQRHNIQPENEIEPEPFVVGWRRDEYNDLVALPTPKYPSPGEPLTKEIAAARFKEELLRMDANRSLNDCVRWLAGKLRDPQSWDHEFSGPPSKLYDTQWSFLMGTWRARGIEPASEEQMQKWAKEYNVAVTKRKRTDMPESAESEGA